MKKSYIANYSLLIPNWFFIMMFLEACATQPASPPPTDTTETATAIGRIVPGYGDHSPVSKLSL
jgi:hypothetical protein